MKKIFIAIGATLVLVAGNAFAEGCHHGQIAEIASLTPDAAAAEEGAVDQVVDPKLLALLKKQAQEGHSENLSTN